MMRLQSSNMAPMVMVNSPCTLQLVEALLSVILYLVSYFSGMGSFLLGTRRENRQGTESET